MALLPALASIHPPIQTSTPASLSAHSPTGGAMDPRRRNVRGPVPQLHQTQETRISPLVDARTIGALPTCGGATEGGGRVFRFSAKPKQDPHRHKKPREDAAGTQHHDIKLLAGASCLMDALQVCIGLALNRYIPSPLIATSRQGPSPMATMACAGWEPVLPAWVGPFICELQQPHRRRCTSSAV